MRCPTCNGGTPESPCVCETQADLYSEPELTLDERWLLAPRDHRDYFTHPDDFGPPEWTGVA